MDENLAALCTVNGGFFTYAEGRDCGYSKNAIARAVARGDWVRLRHGYYTIAEPYLRLDDVGRYRVRCHAVYHRYQGRVALSHQSAAGEHGFALWGYDLSAVHVQRLDGGTSRTEAGVVHHVSDLDHDRDLQRVEGRLVTSKGLSVWESLCNQGQESGLVLVDSALNRSSLSPDELGAVAERYADWRGSRGGRIVLRLADGRAESPGESRTRFLCYRFHLPAPDLQYRVRNEAGVLVARTDFVWLEYAHVGEFDGMVKYGRLLKDGESPSEVVTAEKLREDRVRAECLGMSRVVWSDLSPRYAPRTAERIRHDLDRSRRLYGRARVVIPL